MPPAPGPADFLQRLKTELAESAMKSPVRELLAKGCSGASCTPPSLLKVAGIAFNVLLGISKTASAQLVAKIAIVALDTAAAALQGGATHDMLLRIASGALSFLARALCAFNTATAAKALVKYGPLVHRTAASSSDARPLLHQALKVIFNIHPMPPYSVLAAAFRAFTPHLAKQSDKSAAFLDDQCTPLIKAGDSFAEHDLAWNIICRVQCALKSPKTADPSLSWLLEQAAAHLQTSLLRSAVVAVLTDFARLARSWLLRPAQAPNAQCCGKLLNCFDTAQSVCDPSDALASMGILCARASLAALHSDPTASLEHLNAAQQQVCSTTTPSSTAPLVDMISATARNVALVLRAQSHSAAAAASVHLGLSLFTKHKQPSPSVDAVLEYSAVAAVALSEAKDDTRALLVCSNAIEALPALPLSTAPDDIASSLATILRIVFKHTSLPNPIFSPNAFPKALHATVASAEIAACTAALTATSDDPSRTAALRTRIMRISTDLATACNSESVSASDSTSALILSIDTQRCNLPITDDTVLNQLASLAPSPSVHLLTALALLDRGRLESALASFKAALDLIDENLTLSASLLSLMHSLLFRLRLFPSTPHLNSLLVRAASLEASLASSPVAQARLIDTLARVGDPAAATASLMRLSISLEDNAEAFALLSHAKSLLGLPQTLSISTPKCSTALLATARAALFNGNLILAASSISKTVASISDMLPSNQRLSYKHADEDKSAKRQVQQQQAAGAGSLLSDHLLRDAAPTNASTTTTTTAAPSLVVAPAATPTRRKTRASKSKIIPHEDPTPVLATATPAPSAPSTVHAPSSVSTFAPSLVSAEWLALLSDALSVSAQIRCAIGDDTLAQYYLEKGRDMALRYQVPPTTWLAALRLLNARRYRPCDTKLLDNNNDSSCAAFAPLPSAGTPAALSHASIPLWYNLSCTLSGCCNSSFDSFKPDPTTHPLAHSIVSWRTAVSFKSLPSLRGEQRVRAIIQCITSSSKAFKSAPKALEDAISICQEHVLPGLLRIACSLLTEHTLRAERTTTSTTPCAITALHEGIGASVRFKRRLLDTKKTSTVDALVDSVKDLSITHKESPFVSQPDFTAFHFQQLQSLPTLWVLLTISLSVDGKNVLVSRSTHNSMRVSSSTESSDAVQSFQEWKQSLRASCFTRDTSLNERAQKKAWNDARDVKDAELGELLETMDACLSGVVHEEDGRTNAEGAQGACVILVLGPRVQHVPWESTPTLAGRAVSRMPSVAFVYQRARQLSNGRSTNDDAVWRAKRSCGSYVLNPDGDLTKTQDKLRALMPNGWSGCAGQGEAPTADQFSTALTQHDLFLYCGHGSGAHFLHPTRLSELDCRATAVLMGCSSGALTGGGGEFDPTGIAHAYLCAGSPSVVGCLWDVADFEINDYLELLWSSWFRTEPSPSLAQAAASARDAKTKGRTKPASRRYFTRAAAVVYGIPTILV